MPEIEANGIRLHYDVTGAEDAEPLLLISGVGTQMTRWTQDFVDDLAARGFRVIRMDNRDIGLSQWFDEAGMPDLQAMGAARMRGEMPTGPYSLDDMAADCAALLDALGIEKAHIVGASMGGMIAQLVACDHRGKTLSLTSIMSTTGEPGLPPATDEAMAVLTAPRPDPKTDREGYLDHAVRGTQVIASPGYPEDPALLRDRAAADLDRAFHPAGFARQYAAILCAPSRREKLQALDAPSVVIHGTDDPLVRVEGGRATAAAIPGAEMLEIAGMGHDTPKGLHKTIIDGICRAAGRG